MAIIFCEKTSRNAGDHAGHSATSLTLHDLQRIRASTFAGLLAVGRTTFYERLRVGGSYPRPDGYDGKRPYWRLKTVRDFLSANATGDANNG